MSRRWWLLVGGYFVLRALSSLGRASTRFADTFGFFTVDYWGRESRLWPVPLLYSVITNDTMRVAMHILIGTLAWAFLAFVVARQSRFPLTVSATVLLFGLSPQIIRFDLAILSESIGISLLVLLIAVTIQHLSSPSRATLIVWVVSLTMFSMTRASQLIVLFLITLVAVITVIQKRNTRTVLIASVFVVLSLWAGLQLRNNRSMSELNFYTVLQERVIPDDSRFAWFTQEGMPLSEESRLPPSYDERSDLPGELLDYVKLPIAQLPPTIIRLGGLPLAEWVRDNGWTTYLRYVITHPSDTWSRLADLSSPTLNPADKDLLPLNNRPTAPRFFFLPWQWWAIVGGLAALLHVRFGRRYYTRLFVSGYVIAGVWYAGVVLTSGIEHPRHAITVAIAVRLIALVTIIGLFTGQKATPDLDEDVIP